MYCFSHLPFLCWHNDNFTLQKVRRKTIISNWVSIMYFWGFMHVWADICEMRKVFFTFCWKKMKTILIIIDSIQSFFLSYEPNCLFRYKLIIRKSFSLKMKFKLCDSTDPFISVLLLGTDFIIQHNNLFAIALHTCRTVHLPHWWSLQCLRGGVLLTSWGTVAQGGGVSRLDGGFPLAWWHQALSCPAAGADSGHNPGEHRDRWELA